MKTSKILTLLAIALASAIVISAEERPNVLWITAEDMSPTLGCYGDKDAITPHLDAFAKQSVRYTKAYASAPVCSPSRSCLITGCYPPSLSTQQMRSGFPMPERMKGFPALLRKQGYYTTNNVKTDYNSGNYQDIIKSSWNESSATAHWRKRSDKSSSIFSVFNLMTSHQSRTMVWPREKFLKEVQSKLKPSEIHDPVKITLPPYYPDTPIIRRTVARFHDCVTAMDKEVGAILKQLEEDGLADNTIVFFYSDHGSGMPRHKRALLESGMRVALMIRFPKKWEHLASGKPGSTLDRLVAFVDFAPTVLSLTGTPIPKEMQGQSFLGSKDTKPRKYVYGHRDRVDEVRDLARSVRDDRYLYIRNYMPHLGYNQPTVWPDRGEIRHEFYRLSSPSKMNAAQWHFAGPTRAVEELFDCQNDPHNLNNLAGSKEHREVLERLRKEHRRHIRRTVDLGFLPESEAWSLFEGSSGWEMGQGGKAPVGPSQKAAAQVGMAKEEVFLKNLSSKDPNVRYWGAIGLTALNDKPSGKALKKLKATLKDTSAAVRIEAANALATHDDVKTALPALVKDLAHENLIVVTHAARTIELLGNKAASVAPQMKKALERAEIIRPPDLSPVIVLPGDKDLAMFVAFSCQAFLDGLSK
ncbi:MAG: sulfatase-like hydrolase/transferase [Verrucomicrobia bacterium]|nr:sulfatase-like hydrolase/transferase [Verrucomicrobiota bacterium]